MSLVSIVLICSTLSGWKRNQWNHIDSHSKWSWRWHAWQSISHNYEHNNMLAWKITFTLCCLSRKCYSNEHDYSNC